MTDVTIFGSGNMGTAIDGVLTAGGAVVEHIGSADSDATVAGDIVILAVPYPALETIVANYGPQLAGKVVVDISNPLNFETFDSLTVPRKFRGGRTRRRIALVEGAQGVQYDFAATLGAKTVGPNTTTVLIAGDDTDAKRWLQ